MESSEEDEPIVVEESDDLEGEVLGIGLGIGVEGPENTLAKTHQLVILDDTF